MALSPNFFDHHPLVNIPMGSLEATNILGHVVGFGMDFLSLTGRVFMAHDASGHELAFLTSRGSSSSSVGSAICDDKSLTKSLLSHYGIPSAPSRRVLSLDSAEATEFVEEHGWPVVVKPIRGIGGKGVTANIQTLDQLQRAAQQASGPRGYLIERHVPGDDYRFLVLAGRVIGVWGKTAANVLGDGKSSISELIDLKNQIRANNPHVAARLIKKDTLVRDHLEYSGLDLDHVPDEGITVTLRSASNLSSGGDNVEITDSVHPRSKTSPSTRLLPFRISSSSASISCWRTPSGLPTSSRSTFARSTTIRGSPPTTFRSSARRVRQHGSTSSICWPARALRCRSTAATAATAS